MLNDDGAKSSDERFNEAIGIVVGIHTGRTPSGDLFIRTDARLQDADPKTRRKYIEAWRVIAEATER